MAKKIATKRPTRSSEESALAKKARKQTNTARSATSAKGVVSDRALGAIQALLQSKTPIGVTRGLHMLHTLNAGEVAFKKALTPSVVKTIVESLDLRQWQPVVESLRDLAALRASFECSLLSHFTTLSKQKQRACVDAGITHLRPESVRLFKELVDIVSARAVTDDGLLFSHVTTLTDEAAEVLVDYERELRLPIATVSDNAARWLGQCSNWSLSLPALTALSDAAAKHLARRQGWRLRLGGLRSISDTASALIAKHKGNELDLSGLLNISARTAASLARYEGDKLDLSGLRSISDTVASSLAKFKGDNLKLGGLQALSDAAAAGLAKYKGADLYLTGLRSLSDRVIELLAKGGATFVHLDGLRTVSDGAAHILEQRGPNDPYLTLNGLTGRLSSTAAEALVRGGYSLAPSDGISRPRVEIVFASPVTLEMIKKKSYRGGGRGFAAVAQPTEFCRIVLAGKSYTVTQGRIGTAGQSVKKSFDTEKSALRSFTNKVFNKQMEGFERVTPTA